MRRLFKLMQKLNCFHLQGKFLKKKNKEETKTAWGNRCEFQATYFAKRIACQIANIPSRYLSFPDKEFLQKKVRFHARNCQIIFATLLALQFIPSDLQHFSSALKPKLLSLTKLCSESSLTPRIISNCISIYNTDHSPLPVTIAMCFTPMILLTS
jgi:hypothetical protein